MPPCYGARPPPLLGRFEVDTGPPLHQSATAAVLAATDHVDPDAKPLPRRALKAMREPSQVLTELDARACLSPRTVVGIVAVFADTNIDNATWMKIKTAAGALNCTVGREPNLAQRLASLCDSSIYTGAPSRNAQSVEPPPLKRKRSKTTNSYRFLLVLELGDRDLHDAMSHGAISSDGIAGMDFPLVRKIAVDVAHALEDLHRNRRIHADLKPHNIVCLGNTWRLIDLDVSCTFGETFGEKLPSTGYCPPEFATVLLTTTSGTNPLYCELHTTNPVSYTASVAHDLWSFGVALFHLVFGMPLWRTDQNDNVTRADLCSLANWTTSTFNTKLFEVKQTWRSAPRPVVELLRKLLDREPARRLAQFKAGDEMGSVLKDQWFGASQPSTAEPLGLLIFVSSPTVSPLPNAVLEANEVSALCTCTTQEQYGGTADVMRQLLAKPTRYLLFSGHADAPAPDGSANTTLGFTTTSGFLELIRPEDVGAIVGRAAPSRGGCLELVFLNGCCSESLGKAICDAGVPNVVCWRTQTEDGAARVFARAFFEALETGTTVADSYEAAKLAVMCVTHLGRQAHLHAMVPKYELRAPGTASAMTMVSPEPWAAGVPVLLTN